MDSTREPTDIYGACHCANIQFALSWPQGESEIPIRKCGCTFCQKHCGSWTSHRNSRLAITIADRAAISQYQFGTRTADFYLCKVCGVVPFVLSDIDDNLYAVVNINAFEGTTQLEFSSSSANFDGEDVGSRLERRKRNWIPDVKIE
jgi:hypothetical protein